MGRVPVPAAAVGDAGWVNKGPGGEAVAALAALVAGLPGGEERPEQAEMCRAVAEALAAGHHLAVEAGTGVGKSLAYLVAAVLSGRRVVVATARKPLQDQLINKDIPVVAAALGGVDAAVLKGRSNYLCLAKLAEATGGDQGQLIADRRRPVLDQLADWALTPGAGDMGAAPVEVGPGLMGLVTVGPRECPGAASCDRGEECLAEKALARAREAQLVVTNIDLYCLDTAIGGALLGDHDAVVFDEAHELENVASRTFGLELGRRRFAWLAGQLRGLMVAGSEEPARLERVGDSVAAALAPATGQRLDVTEPSVAGALAAADEVLSAVTSLLRKLPSGAGSGSGGGGPSGAGGGGEPGAGGRRDGRRDRCLQAASSLLEDLRRARAPQAGDVVYVPEGPEPVLTVAPVDVGPVLAQRVYRRRTAILTSATLSVGGDVDPVAHRLGLRPALLAGERVGGDESGEGPDDPDGPGDRGADDPDGELDGGGGGPGEGGRAVVGLRLGSPFDYRANALLYCPVHLPDPRQMPRSFDAAALDELASLMEAAGGRTLGLFTSHRMLRLASESFKDRFPWAVHVQDGPPSPGLIERFRDDETSCLLATMGYWQGMDVPGRSLTLVVIDRLPFPSPRDPLLEARRQAAQNEQRVPFEAVDLPLAATLLAQGAGRLVRTATDRGVVAVLDRRLAKARYKAALLRSLPPMRRSIDGAEVRAYLAQLAAGEI